MLEEELEELEESPSHLLQRNISWTLLKRASVYSSTMAGSGFSLQ